MKTEPKFRVTAHRHNQSLDHALMIRGESIEIMDGDDLPNTKDYPALRGNEVVLKIYDASGYITITMMRHQAYEFAQELLDQSAMICEDCGIDIIGEQFRGYCIDCYANHSDTC